MSCFRFVSFLNRFVSFRFVLFFAFCLSEGEGGSQKTKKGKAQGRFGMGLVNGEWTTDTHDMGERGEVIWMDWTGLNWMDWYLPSSVCLSSFALTCFALLCFSTYVLSVCFSFTLDMQLHCIASCLAYGWVRNELN